MWVYFEQLRWIKLLTLNLNAFGTQWLWRDVRFWVRFPCKPEFSIWVQMLCDMGVAYPLESGHSTATLRGPALPGPNFSTFVSCKFFIETLCPGFATSSCWYGCSVFIKSIPSCAKFAFVSSARCFIPPTWLSSCKWWEIEEAESSFPWLLDTAFSRERGGGIWGRLKSVVFSGESFLSDTILWSRRLRFLLKSN